MAEKVKKDDALLKTARDRYELASKAESENREAALDDIRFIAGDQWPEEIRNQRKNRPCLTINKLRPMIRTVLGDQRQNKVNIKVKPVDDESDPILAEINEGLIRNIESQSQGTTVYALGFEQSLSGGFGYWRVVAEYEEDGFDQALKIKPIRSQFSVFFDPSSVEVDYSDAMFCFVMDEMGKDEFKEAYPKADPSNFESKGVGEAYTSWYSSETVRIAEYYYKEPVTRKLAQLADGSVIELKDGLDVEDLALQGIEVKRTRESKGHKVMWCKMTGCEVLEGPKEIPGSGRYLPVIPVIGDEQIVDGKRVYHSLVRFSKDPQRMFNYWKSAATEMVALAPKTPFLVTDEQIEGKEAEWNNANTTPKPYLRYNHTPAGKPGREPQPQIPTGIMAEIAGSDDDIKSTSGMYDARMGAKGNETSAKAIIARQRRSDVSTFVFVDNLNRAIEHTGRILIDMIPRVYDSNRVVRVLGKDGEASVEINRTVYDIATGRTIIINDLSVGKFDVEIEVGPAMATQRLEEADLMMGFVQYAPNVFPLIGDLIAEKMGAHDIAERLHKMLPPQITGQQEPGQAPQGMPQGGAPAQPMA